MAETKKIMVVEDERITAQDIQVSLEKFGYEVPAVVSSGKDAIKAAMEFKPDLILMDIVIRGEMNGIQTAQAIRSEYKVPIVYLTAYADQDTINRAKKTEPYGYILKPFEDRELQSIIEMALYKHGMEKKLQESEEWLSITLKSIGEGVIATDCDENIVLMNSSAESLTGWQEEKARGQSLGDILKIVNSESQEPIHIKLRDVSKNKNIKALTENTHLLSQKGHSIPVECKSSLLKDAHDDVYGLVVVFQDITKRHHAEQALLESEERYRTLFEDSRDAIYLITKEGNFVTVNKAVLNLLKFTKEEISSLNIRDIYTDPDEREKFRDIIDTKGSVRDYEVKLKNKKGEVLDCLLTASIKKDSDGTILGYQGIIRDITARKKAEREKEQIQAQLFQAQKMEAIGILAGGVAHDLNNMMTAVQGFTDMAMMKTDAESPVYSDLEEVVTASSRATELTRQLLLFSRKQPMAFQTVNTNDVIRQLIKMLKRLIGEDVIIKTHLISDLNMVRADAGNLEQVVMNLALNARDAMPEGGQVSIKTNNITIDDDYCEHHSEAAPGKYIQIIVEDNGSGMSDETVEHIFDPFFSTKGPGKGTGLGLSVVYGIVKQHEGWIDVESEIDVGTRFVVYIPARKGKVTESGKEKSTFAQYQGKGERILVVEDEVSVRDLIMRVLDKNGYKGKSANDSEEALKIFKKEKGAFDLVLSDVVLPGQSGIELVEILKKRKPDLKIILSSGYPDKKSQWDIIQERGYRFLQKSYTLSVLLKAIREELDS